MADSRHPDDPQRTVNRHFYLPPFGSFGEDEYARYNQAREDLDEFIRGFQDKFYTQPRIWDYALDVPDISSFYDLAAIPHWRTLRGFWKFEDEPGTPHLIDESIYGHDGASRWTARIMPNAWRNIGPSLSTKWPVGFFLGNGDACIEARTLNGEKDREGLAAIIPGALHQYPVNPITGLRELTVEFWWSPTVNITGGDANGNGGTYVNNACIFSKLSRWVITNDFRWVSDEMTIGILPPDPDCLQGSGPLGMSTHRFDPKYFPRNICDYDDWAYCQSPQASWRKDQWYYVAATWSERLGTRITVNAQRDRAYGADDSAIPNDPPFRFKDKGMPADGFLSNLLIGNYHDRWKTQSGIDMLFSNLRISNRIVPDKEIIANYNSGKGRFLDVDEFTIGLWHFLEGDGKYSRNLATDRKSNFPVLKETGMVKTGYISQPLPNEEASSSDGSHTPAGLGLGSSSSGSSESEESSSGVEGTYAGKFVAADETYLDCGDEYYLNMQTFGGDVALKMSVVTGIKRDGLGTRQTIISKFAEPDKKQFWFGINEDDQLEVILGKGANAGLGLFVDILENPYDYAVVENADVPRYNGLYVGEAGWNSLASSSAEEDSSAIEAGSSSSESSVSTTSGEESPADFVQFFGHVDVTDAPTEAANGRYELESFPGNPEDPEFFFPYITMEGAGNDRVNGIYVPEEAWDTARLIYQDLTLPFPNVKVEGSTKFRLDGTPVTGDPLDPYIPGLPGEEGSSDTSSEASDTSDSSASDSSSSGSSESTTPEEEVLIDYDGVYVNQEHWAEALDAVYGYPVDDTRILTWTTSDGYNTYPVWRKVTLDRDLAMFHAGTLWDGWVMAENLEYASSVYYAYKMRHGQPPLTWFNQSNLGILDNPRFVRSEEFYTEGLVTLDRWRNGGIASYRKVDNVDMELYVDFNNFAVQEWQLGLYETEELFIMYWAAYSATDFPGQFYGFEGVDPGPVSKVFNIPSLQGTEGKVVWRNQKNNGFVMFKDISPWVENWTGWFIGLGDDHQNNYYWSEVSPGVTDIIPPSQWFLDYLGDGQIATPVAVRYPLQWEIEGRPIYRKWEDPAFVLSTGNYPFNGWFGWWLGKGADNGVTAMWWAEDNECFIPALFYVSTDGVDTGQHFYDAFLPLNEKITAAQLPRVESFPEYAECTRRGINLGRIPGVETFTAVSTDRLLDTESFHQIAFTWGKHFNGGLPTLYIDGKEVAGYEIREFFEGTLPWLNQSNEYPLTWAPVQIGRTCGITEEAPSSSSSDSSCSSSCPSSSCSSNSDCEELFGGMVFDPLTEDPQIGALGEEGPWSGSTLGSPWPGLLAAINKLPEGPQTFTLQISTMLPGNLASGHDGELRTTMELEDYGIGEVTVDHLEFQKEVCNGLLEWKKLFEAVFTAVNGYGHDLTFIIDDLGDEGPGAPPSSPGTPPYPLPMVPGNVGDVRVCMIPIDGPSSILAFAFSPGSAAGTVGSVGGDMRFDPDEDWRPDGIGEAGAISILYVAAHEFGHTLGVGHDGDPTSLMFPALTDQTDNFADLWPLGLIDSPADCRSVQEVYGFPQPPSEESSTSSESDFSVSASSVSSVEGDVCPNPGWYLDATLDELMLFASWLLPQQIAELNAHLIEGVQDGDRWLITDPNIRYVSGNKLVDERDNELVGDILADNPSRESEWALWKNHIAEWRRDPITGEFDWTYVPTEFSAVFWNQERGRLDSFLPDEYFELYGDYGVTGTGDFSVG